MKTNVDFLPLILQVSGVRKLFTRHKSCVNFQQQIKNRAMSLSLRCFSEMFRDSVVCWQCRWESTPPPLSCCHHFNWLVVHCLAAVRGEGQERTQQCISLVRLQKVSGGRSLGTKANMGALKLGNFSHNASLKADNRGESFGSDSLCCWNPRASRGAVRRLSDLGQSRVDRDYCKNKWQHFCYFTGSAKNT